MVTNAEGRILMKFTGRNGAPVSYRVGAETFRVSRDCYVWALSEDVENMLGTGGFWRLGTEDELVNDVLKNTAFPIPTRTPRIAERNEPIFIPAFVKEEKRETVKRDTKVSTALKVDKVFIQPTESTPQEQPVKKKAKDKTEWSKVVFHPLQKWELETLYRLEHERYGDTESALLSRIFELESLRELRNRLRGRMVA